MSRLTWAAASPLLAGLYADHPAAWPQAFAPMHLARLQLPDGTPMQRTAYAQAIEQACAAGELSSAPAEFTKWPAILGMHGDGSDTEESLRAQCQVFTWPAIRAADFLAWLVRERAEPSAHVRSWFAATDSADSRNAGPPATRRRYAIEAEASKAGIQLTAVRHGDKAKLRALVLADRAACATARTFDQTWQAMRDQGLIADAAEPTLHASRVSG